MPLSRRTLMAAGLALMDVGIAQAATFPLRAAGNWPQRPVKFIIPNAPGSSVDTIGRLLMNEMAKSLQQAGVADNKAGAAGALGAEAARMAAVLQAMSSRASSPQKLLWSNISGPPSG